MDEVKRESSKGETYVALGVKINLIMPVDFDKKELGRATARWLRERQRGKLLEPIVLKFEGYNQYYLRFIAAVPETSEIATRSYMLTHGLEEYLRNALCIERVIVGDYFSHDYAVHRLRGKKLTLHPPREL